MIAQQWAVPAVGVREGDVALEAVADNKDAFLGPELARNRCREGSRRFAIVDDFGVWLDENALKHVIGRQYTGEMCGHTSTRGCRKHGSGATARARDIVRNLAREFRHLASHDRIEFAAWGLSRTRSFT